MLSAKKQVEMVLQGISIGCVPFTIYESKLPQCEAERMLRNRKMCIVNRSVPVFETITPNVDVRECIYNNATGKQISEKIYKTPVGEVSRIVEKTNFTQWIKAYPFKGPQDYKVLNYILSDEQYVPCYDKLISAQNYAGEDIIFRSNFGLEPLQHLISGGIMSMQDFCIEWLDNRDEIMKLYNILVEKRRKVYPIVAQSPVLHANYGGNVTVPVIGPKVFEEFYLPHYAEAAEFMHKNGKKIGSHFDGECRNIANLIADSALDYIEAFTPSPDTSMTLEDVKKIWPNKILWLNFPSSMHLASDEKIEDFTVKMFSSLTNIDNIIMGITEDMPENRWRDSCLAIINGLDKIIKPKKENK